MENSAALPSAFFPCMTQCSIPVAELAKEMEKAGQEMGLSIHVQREDIFQAMHRI